MHALIEQIVDTGTVRDRKGNTHRLRDHVSSAEGRFLGRLIREFDVRTSLEVGCAYGISSLWICEALADRPSPRHVIVDAFQSEKWLGIGVQHLDDAGFGFYEMIEELSELALPSLLDRGERFDFAFIDGMHTFDHTLIDFFYINRMLNVGGIVVFDDTCLPGVARVARYVLNYPNYELVGVVGGERSASRELLERVKGAVGKVGSRLLGRHASELFDAGVLNPALRISPHASMVALRKTGPDSRDWDWYKPF